MGEVDPQQEDFEESLVQSVIAEWVKYWYTLIIIYHHSISCTISISHNVTIWPSSLLCMQRNPPDEQGIREEWKKEIGWHRKEDIYSGLRRPKNNATSKVKGLKTQNAINKRQSSTLRLSSYSSWTIFFLLIMLVVCIIVDRIKRGQKFKHNMI